MQLSSTLYSDTIMTTPKVTNATVTVITQIDLNTALKLSENPPEKSSTFQTSLVITIYTYVTDLYH